MIGFSFKNFVLQVVHGAVVLISLIWLLFNSITNFIDHLRDFETISAVLFLCASFIAGVIIDLIADNLESFVIKLGIITPPCFFLLTRERWWGITLAHRKAILDDLCTIAGEYAANGQKPIEYKTKFIAKKIETINYILQVAKNKAFGNCSDYQKEQIESFFVLYIFSRNMSLSLIFPLVLFFCAHILLTIIFFVFILLAIIAAYRYFLYYSRILLGSTINVKK